MTKTPLTDAEKKQIAVFFSTHNPGPRLGWGWKLPPRSAAEAEGIAARLNEIAEELAAHVSFCKVVDVVDARNAEAGIDEGFEWGSVYMDDFGYPEYESRNTRLAIWDEQECTRLACRVLGMAYRVWAHCRRCDREVEVAIGRPASRCGWDTSSHQIRQRLRCAHCGAKGHEIGMKLVSDARPGFGSQCFTTEIVK